MHNAELIASIQKQDKAVQKEVFEAYYGRLAAIAERYSKNASQAQELILAGFSNCLRKLQLVRQTDEINLDEFMQKGFILECISYLKSNRGEYYVSSTVYATQ